MAGTLPKLRSRAAKPTLVVVRRLLLALLLLPGCANKAPLLSLSADALRLPGGVERTVWFEATDPEGAALTITVEATRGAAELDGPVIRYVAPVEPGDDSITLRADDGTTSTAAVLDVVVDAAFAWSEPEQVAATPGNSKSPTLAATADGVVHIAWHDFTDDPSTLRHAWRGDDGWTVATPDLGPDKVLRAQLRADGDRLHLVYERFLEGAYDLRHSVFADGAWGAPEHVGSGRKTALALHDGRLHAVWFGEDDVVTHGWLTDAGWESAPVPLDAPFINPIRVALVGTDSGLELGLLLSPGDTSYDMNVARWNPEGGWAQPAILHVSMFLGAEEPAGAAGPDGARWAWAEQDPDALDTFEVVTMRTDDDAPVSVSALPGLNAAPTLAVPNPGGAQVAWIAEGFDLYVLAAPFDGEPLLLRPLSIAPQMAVDVDGYLHLAWIGDVDGIEQVQYATTRP